MSMCSQVVISLLRARRGEGRARRLLDIIHIWGAFGILMRDHPSGRRALLMRPHIEYSQSGTQLSYPLPMHRAYARPELSPGPAPSSSKGIAPQLMCHSFTHLGGRPDHLQRPPTKDPIARAQTSRSSSHLDSGSSKPRRSKRKRPSDSERGISAPQPIVIHRDKGDPQRSHRGHYNITEKTQSIMLPSGGMYMTPPLDIPSPEPDTEGRVRPPPFEHGPTELPPRSYESNPQAAEREGSGRERPAKRGRLPADLDKRKVTRW
ncbi:hypothetical protein BJY52DRAFT_1311858 [Lactarius psammicola]|nr:hypothetical protein BJY52DRAFT_1311858 [Lactarius psammicola]